MAEQTRKRVIGLGFVAGIVVIWGAYSRSLGPPRIVKPARAASQRGGGAQAGQALIDQGKVLFGKHCSICHGEQGDGQGRFAYLMNPRPRNFLTAKFKLSTTVNQIPADEDLLRTIGRGMPGSAMPPWSHLPEPQLRALAAYVRNLGDEIKRKLFAQDVTDGVLDASEAKEELALQTHPGQPIPVPAEPSFEEERWFEGRRLYLEGCAACHGVTGHPDANIDIKQDDEGYPVTPRSFVLGVFKGGNEGAQLYARLFKGMRGTPMPAYEGTYPPEKLWDMVHYIQSLAQAGSQDRAWLRRSTITAKRVAPGSLPADPRGPEWADAPPTHVSLTPLWWRHDRIEGVLVQALHDTKEIVIRLTWLDGASNHQAVRAQDFRDAVAIQFASTKDPPFYMGQSGPGGGVTMWHWKADREINVAQGYQDEDHAYPDRVVDYYPALITSKDSLGKLENAWRKNTPPQRLIGVIAEHNPTYITGWGAGNLVSNPKLTSSVVTLEARGPGTLSSRPSIDQTVIGKGAHHNGAWYVQMRRSMTAPAKRDAAQNGATAINFKPGSPITLSFAIWDGQAGDRDGKKQISIWQELVIE